MCKEGGGLLCEWGMTHVCAREGAGGWGGMWGVGVGGRWGDECDTRVCKGREVEEWREVGCGECCTRVCKEGGRLGLGQAGRGENKRVGGE